MEVGVRRGAHFQLAGLSEAHREIARARNEETNVNMLK
jgi:hypothetical protein